MKEWFKKLSGKDKINFLLYVILTAIFIIGGLINVVYPFLSISQLLGFVVFALGLACFENLLDKFYYMLDIKVNMQEIKNSQLKVETNTVILSTRRKIEQTYSLFERYEDAKEIKMFSYANSLLFQQNYCDLMKECIEKGTSFKFVGLTPSVSSDRIQKLMSNGMLNHKGTVNPMAETLEKYSEIKKINKFSDKKLLYKVLDLDFPYGMTIVYKQSGETTVKIDLYTFGTNNLNKRCMFITTKNPAQQELVNFYEAQWDEVWKKAVTYTPG